MLQTWYRRVPRHYQAHCHLFWFCYRVETTAVIGQPYKSDNFCCGGFSPALGSLYITVGPPRSMPCPPLFFISPSHLLPIHHPSILKTSRILCFLHISHLELWRVGIRRHSFIWSKLRWRSLPWGGGVLSLPPGALGAAGCTNYLGNEGTT
ncbi:hypothetical protein LZ32DRAFT_242030 [Colletotrichum eremochloae]|nr:hypothetical protein LZ32DRAFT_242030 [Colletotrichum eremochloae]